jgi:hypothetical protein
MLFRIDNGQAAQISVLAAEQTLAPIVRELQQTLGSNRPTLDGLRRLADWLGSCGLADPTISAAWQFWIWMGHFRGECATATKSHALIAYWYKIDPFTLSEAQQVGLIANLHRLQCQDRIYRRDFDPIDYEGVYQLFKAAYDDEDLAQRQKAAAFSIYVERRIGSK